MKKGILPGLMLILILPVKGQEKVASNPLAMADGRVVWGVEDQTRFEYRENNFDFNSGADSLTDDAWLLQRFRLNLKLEPVSWLRLFFEGQDSQEIGSRRDDVPGQLGAEGDNTFDLRQAWIEWGDAKTFPLSVKVGRQVLLYGDQRLIGPLDWSNLSRTFDAVKVRWTGKDGLWVDAFVSSVVVADHDGFDESDLDSLFSGVYAHIPSFGIQDTELYALAMEDTDRDDHFVTLGTHIKSLPGKLGSWDYEGELAFQTGTAAGKNLRAFAGYLEGGYTFTRPWKPRLSLEYGYGSGDGDPADGDIRSFQNLYPTNHLHYGYMDVFSWSNMHDAVLHLSAKPHPKITASLDWHSFWIADTADTWRRANAKTAVRDADASASSYAGSEIDALMTFSAYSHLNVSLGYSHFFAGHYLSDTGAASGADFVYVMTSLKF
jgi:hypothetical protein